MMKTILLIDDDAMFRLVLAEWLESQGFTTIMAQSGSEGIQLAQCYHPDAIFCEAHMPSIDGIEVLNQVRGNTHTTHIPFFFLTAESEFGLRPLRKLNVAGVIQKGAEIYDFRQALNAICA